jgi:hypothetical protein
MLFPEDPQTTTDVPLTCRRGVLGTLGLAGLGLLAGTGTSEAFTDVKKSGSMPKVSVPTSSQSSVTRSVPFTLQPDLPEEWAALNVRDANDYFRYLNSLGLKRISPAQVVATHAKSKGNVWNTLPPRAWWKRMGYTLRVVERIALEMNVSQVEVISAYRAPAYNAHCEGARTGSWHQANIAADVKFPVRASKVTATARELRNLGLFKGGVGGYWDFTHIDCRGENINW